MDSSDKFTEELWHALRHLRVPGYQPTEFLCTIVGCETNATGAFFQSAIVHAIRALEPSPETPQGARSRLLYEILNQRYIVGCTQEQTAEVLGVSVRQLNRLQHESVQQLALRLWEAHLFRRSPEAASPDASAFGSETASPSVSKAESWQAQVMQDVVALTEQGGTVTTDLGLELRAALSLAQSLIQGLTFVMREEQQDAQIGVRVHPSALHQIVLAVTRELLNAVPCNNVECSVFQTGDEAVVQLQVEGRPSAHPMSLDLAEELLRACGGTMGQTKGPTRVSVTLYLPICAPSAERFTVLAIDDNDDLMTLFGAYCTGTLYDLVHVRSGGRALLAVEEHHPDIILLDVMLPDMDGWDLLKSLRASLPSQTTPIIVCSVITEEQLALALGATACLRKPVWRQQLLDAFGKVLNRDPA